MRSFVKINSREMVESLCRLLVQADQALFRSQICPSALFAGVEISRKIPNLQLSF